MRKLFLTLFAVLTLSLFLQPVQGQTLEQVKQAHVQKSLATPDGKIIKQKVDEYSTKYNVDPTLVHAIIMTESSYNKNAKSSCGATGLMQLMPSTFKARGGSNIYSIDENIHAGTKHFAGLLARYKGNVYLALAAYNMGGGRIQAGQPIPSAGKLYVDRVMYHKRIIETIEM